MSVNWHQAPLIEFAELVSTGPFGSMLHKSDYVSNGVPLINPINIVDEDIVPDADKQVGEEALARLSSYVLMEDDVVVGRRGEIGRCAVVGPAESGWVCGTGCFFVRPRPDLDARFLAHLLRSPIYRDQLEKASTGATMKNMSNTALAHLLVSVPSLDEQQRIVAIVDEAFEGIATAKANTEKNLQNAREILASAIRQVFDSLGKRYESRSLGSVCKFENGDRGKNYPGKEHRVVQGIPFINAGHLTPTGVDLASMDYITPERFALLGNGKIQSGDILFCLRGSLGKYASIGDLTSGAIASSLVILRPTNELDHGYLLSFLSSTLCSEQIEAYKGGAAQPNLGAKDLKQFELPLPPLEMQQLVSDRVMELQESTFELLNVTNKKLAALDELKKSLLHQAFSGKL